ncbi:MAG: response regulator [Defluviitaleaceae bacterium]|nr:response regulator [Defluviitaleaceae bacterium]
MKTIFVVDDNDTNLLAAKNALDGTYKTFALPSAARMFKLVEKITPDLILLDIEMPEMSGFDAITVLKSDNRLKDIPVIFLTLKNDEETEIQGFKLGAIDFINKPFSAPVLIRRLETHIDINKIVKQSQQTIRDLHNATISVIADMVENRDHITGGHIERTQAYLKILLDELVISGIYAKEIKHWDTSLLLPSAQLHDVGKIIISDLILNKPGKLTDEEFFLMKEHSAEGERIVKAISAKVKDDGFLTHAAAFAGYHHEKWDGSGYPYAIKGTEIPLEGRLMAIADVYDALVSERPYKKPFSHEKAVEIIKEGSGSHFEPALVEIFAKVSDDFRTAIIR